MNHHGSAHSSNDVYVDTLNPDVSIISCGYDNRHSHPAQDTLDRLLATSEVYLTEKGDPNHSYGDAVICDANIVIKSSDGIIYMVNGDSYTTSQPVAWRRIAPLIGLAGVLTLGTFVAVRTRRRA